MSIPESFGSPPIEIFDETPERAMVVFAHPDDAEIGAGGTVAKWARDGCEVSYVQCTSGSSGSNDPSVSSDDIVPIRAEEQRAAAQVVGVKRLIVLDHADGELEANRRFLGELVEALRTCRPGVALCHDPYRMTGFHHRDHRMAGFTIMDAIYPYARDHLHFPEHVRKGLKPHKTRHLLFWGSDSPNTVVDVSSTIDVQIEALSRHRSQIPGLRRGSDVESRMRERRRRNAAGMPFEYGELFRRISTRA